MWGSTAGHPISVYEVLNLRNASYAIPNWEIFLYWLCAYSVISVNQTYNGLM